MAHILIADHRAPRRSFLAIVLEQMGHQVTETDQADKVRQILRHSPPDLILLDVLLATQGREPPLADWMAAPQEARVRLMLMASPFLERDARQLAWRCGMARILPDLSDTEALQAAITGVLQEAPPVPKSTDPAWEQDLARLGKQLYTRMAQLENTNARLERHALIHDQLLSAARVALDQEVDRRRLNRLRLLRENQRLRSLSLRDPLTGLYNRRYLEESLEREESRARRSGRPLSLMMMDIDHFKRCNDTYGHAAGDEVLRVVSRCMAAHTRHEDILCRYGGEEFVLVMANAPPEALWRRASDLHRDIPRLSITHQEKPLAPITLSIGLAMFPENGSSAWAALQAADAALYEAKLGGRNRIVAGDSLSQNPA